MHECTESSRNTLSRNQQLLKTIRFSANTVADHVNDLVGDTQCQLKETCEDVAHLVAIHESTDVANIAQFAVLSEASMRTFC
jgi:preprotein translocase subunit SecA